MAWKGEKREGKGGKEGGGGRKKAGEKNQLALQLRHWLRRPASFILTEKGRKKERRERE